MASSSIEMTSTGLTVGGLTCGDGSWELRVHVTDLQVERSLRVRGDLHVGGLMIRLVDELGKAILLLHYSLLLYRHHPTNQHHFIHGKK